MLQQNEEDESAGILGEGCKRDMARKRGYDRRGERDSVVGILVKHICYKIHLLLCCCDLLCR